jgi:WD40 repeat protein
VTGGSDRATRVWDLSTPHLVAHQGGGHAPSAPAVEPRVDRWTSPDGSKVAILKGDQKVFVEWNGTTGPLLFHGSSVKHAAFSPDGKSLITGSDDNIARIWDWSTGKLLAAPLSHRGSVRYAAFSPDGRRVVTDCANHTVRAWDTSSGEPLTPPLPYDGVVQKAVFSEDGRSLTVTDHGTSQTWDLSPDDRPLAELVAWAKLLSGGKIDQARGFLPLEPEELQKSWDAVRPFSEPAMSHH